MIAISISKISKIQTKFFIDATKEDEAILFCNHLCIIEQIPQYRAEYGKLLSFQLLLNHTADTDFVSDY